MHRQDRHLWFIILLVAITLTGCGRNHERVVVQQKSIPHPNPTSYDFAASIGSVKNALKQAFSIQWQSSEGRKNEGSVWRGEGSAAARELLTTELHLPRGMLFWKGDADALSRHLLTRPGNEDDAYFYSTDSPVGESRIYFAGVQPALYYADFHIHLTALGPETTRVEIIPYGPFIVTGMDDRLTRHGRGTFIAAKVEASTIEEYEILLRIGEQLHTKGMPALVVPETKGPVKEVVLPRMH